MGDMNRKVFRGELKEVGDAGTFEAIIATLGVVDHDGDIVEPGALAGKVASIVPAHQQHTIPLGRVRIEERGQSVVAIGKWNLEIQGAREWDAALKFDLAHPPAVQEWSWGYQVLDSEDAVINGEHVRKLKSVDLIEVSPVLRGASIGTRTLAAKSADRVKLIEQIQAVTAQAEAAKARFVEARKLRQESGREMSKESIAAVLDMSTSLAEFRKCVDEVMDLAREVLPQDEVSRAVAAFAMAEARLTGI